MGALCNDIRRAVKTTPTILPVPSSSTASPKKSNSWDCQVCTAYRLCLDQELSLHLPKSSFWNLEASWLADANCNRTNLWKWIIENQISKSLCTICHNPGLLLPHSFGLIQCKCFKKKWKMNLIYNFICVGMLGWSTTKQYFCGNVKGVLLSQMSHGK